METLGVTRLANLLPFKMPSICRDPTENKIKNWKFQSKRRVIRGGVPQGLILGPVLFLIYINGMVGLVPEESIFLFANNITLFTKRKILNNLKSRCFKNWTNWLNLFRTSLAISAFKHIREANSIKQWVWQYLFMRTTSVLLNQQNFWEWGWTALSWSDQVEEIGKRISSGLFVLWKNINLNNVNL